MRPIELEIAGADKAVPSTKLIQHTWNRLIEDFVRAVRNDDKDHQRYPSHPTLADGLRTEEVIDAARRSSNTEATWAAGDCDSVPRPVRLPGRLRAFRG